MLSLAASDLSCASSDAGQPSNVVPFGHVFEDGEGDAPTAPVVFDFAEAARPRSEAALRIAADAAAQFAKLETAEKKAGTLRVLSNQRNDLFMINPYLIEVRPGWNRRKMADPANLAHIDQTARSIAKGGVKQPLTVVLEGTSMWLIDGHVRLLATMRAIEVYGADIRGVPVMTWVGKPDEAARKADQLVRNGGKPLAVMEVGEIYVDLTNFGWSPKQIGDTHGVGEARVRQVLALMYGATEGIKAVVDAGKAAPATAALALRGVRGDGARVEKVIAAAGEIAAKAGKERVTPKHVRAALAAAQPAAPARPSAKDALRAVFEADTTVVEADGARPVRITMSARDWKTITRVLDI